MKTTPDPAFPVPGGACNLMFSRPATSPSWSSATALPPASGTSSSNDGKEIVTRFFSAPNDPFPAAHDDAGDGSDTLNVDADGLVSVSTMTAPNELTVTVLLDGAEVASEMFEPDYAIEEPNGRGCGERRLWSVELDW